MQQRLSGSEGGSQRQKLISFGSLLPIILPELDKDRAMQLDSFYTKLRRNEISKQGFVGHMKNIVGDKMLRLAVLKMQSKAQAQEQAQARNPPQQFGDTYSFGHPNPMGCHGTISVQGLAEPQQQQQHLQFSQSSGATTYQPYAMVRPQAQAHDHGDGTSQVVGTINIHNTYNNAVPVPVPNIMPSPITQHNSTHCQAMSSPMNYVKQEPPDKHPKPPLFQISSSMQVNQRKGPATAHHEMSAMQNSALVTGTHGITSTTISSQMNTDAQVGSQSALGGPMSGIDGASKKSIKKPISGQKKPLDALASSPPLPSKKQKVSGSFADQSIQHLNDVTAVSGVNLREEEEQLFSIPKDDYRVSEASRKAVLEEEDRLILQKLPLKKKLAEIMTRCGLKNLSNDVERCISLCVEERLRALIGSLIRISKQRADSEKSKHNTVVTSDVRKQIMMINQKAREEGEKKQAEADKLRKQNEQPESSAALDLGKEKEDGRGKSKKANKDEDDKRRTTAANVAARAAVGGDDMLSKWQLMAQARQKRDGGSETGTSSQVGTGSARDTQGTGRKDHSVQSTPGSMRQVGRSQMNTLPPRVAPSISLKDVIAVLEREPQMAKSTIFYRLYDKLHAADTT